MEKKKKVSFEPTNGAQRSKQGLERGKGEESTHSWTRLATKKWTTAVKPGLPKSSSEQLVDPEKRDALSKSLDLKTLFEYLNSSEESALEVALSAFHHRIEQDYQSKLAADSAKSPQDAEQTKDEANEVATNDLLPANSLLQQYLEHSPETNELWTILNLCVKKDKTKGTTATMLLSCFASVLKFTTWPHLKYIRNNIARTFTKSHIHMCSSNLASDQPMLINATFSLLTEIINVSQFHARDLFSTFNWAQKSFFQLVTRKNASYEGRQADKDKDKKDASTVTLPKVSKDSKSSKPGELSSQSQPTQEYQRLYLLDIRTHFIQFGLAFLEHDDPSLIQDVLGVTGFLSSIFKDMQYDATALILQTFETLHEHVLLNKSVSKTCKVHFFTSWILSQISAVYKRFTLRSADDKLGALASLTRRRLQAFLESLLTSSTEGIIYLDVAKPFPPSARLLAANEDLALSASSTSTSAPQQQFHSRNRNILKFFNTLQPQESDWHEKLLLKVLDKDALLAKQYFNDLKLSIEPRPTNQWLNNISLLMKLLDVRPIDYHALVVAATTDLASFSFERVVAWHVPPCCLQRAYLSAGLRHANISVRFVTINLIHRMLSVLDDVSTAFQAELSSAPAKETTLLQQIYDGISNVFKRKVPDLDTILTLYNANIAVDTSKPAPKATTEAQEFALDVDGDMLNTQIMILMSAYMRRFPESFIELNFDLGKLFAIAQPWTQTLRVQDGLLTMLECAAPKLRWNAPLPGTSKEKATQLGYLLQYAISSHDSDVQHRVSQLCRQLLISSGLLDRSPSEIDAWLGTLIHSYPHPSCATYLESALSFLSISPHYWAEEMNRHILATADTELQTKWRLAQFSSSATMLPFSLLTLAIVKDHAHILVQSLGGIATIDTRMQAPETWSQISQVSEFLVSTVAQLLLSSEVPLPLIHAITSSVETPTGPLPSHDTGRGKPTPLPDDILKTPSFTALFQNLSGFIHKIFGVMLTRPEGLGIDLALPAASEWAAARLSLQLSIFEYGYLAEHLGFVPVTSIATAPMGAAALETLEWDKLGAVHFFCHLLSSPYRNVLVYEERVKTVALRLISEPSAVVPSAQTLLFFVSTFLEDPNSGDCLQFALHLLSTLFFQTLSSIQHSKAPPTSTKSSSDAVAPASLSGSTVIPKVEQPTPGVTSSKILRLILGNPSLNAHFLRDLTSPASIALNGIIAQVLGAIVAQSAHYLADDVKELVAIPLTKLSHVFDGLVRAKDFASIVQCIPLIRTLSCFATPSIYEDMIHTMATVPPKTLLSEGGRPLLDLLVSMFLHVSSSHNAVFKLSTPCFRFGSPPVNVAHVVHPSVLEEMKRAAPIFEAPLCSLSTFSALASLQQYCASKQHKSLPDDMALLISNLDGAVFRLLLSSFNTSGLISTQSQLSSTGALQNVNVEDMPLGDSGYISKLPAPNMTPDFSLLVSDEMLDDLINSLRKHLESKAPSPSDDHLPFVAMLHRAAMLSLLPERSFARPTFVKLLSKFSKDLDSPVYDSPLKTSALMEDIERGSTSFANALENAFASHSKHWFLLVLLHSYLVHGISVDEKLVMKCFKPFVGAVVGTVLHHPHIKNMSPTLSTLLEYIVDFGVPILRRFIQNGHHSSLMSNKESDSLRSALAELVNSKKPFVNLQVDLMADVYRSTGSLDTLLQLLVLQASSTIQTLAKLEDSPSMEVDMNDSLALEERLALLLDHLNSLVHVASKLSESALLKAFRRLLRFGYECAPVLEWVLAVANASSNPKPLLAQLHDLLVSHSSFVKILLTKEQLPPSATTTASTRTQAVPKRAKVSGDEAKACVLLLQLLCLVYAAEPEESTKFSPKMLALYLSAYRATLSPSDQLMLHIVMLFEGHGVSFSQAGFLWGTVAQEYKSTSSTLAKKSDSMDVDTKAASDDEEEDGQEKSGLPQVELSTFHSLLLGGQLTQHRQMLTTVRSFSPHLPLATGVHFLDAEALWPRSSSQTLRTSPLSVYDPRFLLYVYQFGLNFFPEFDVKKFIEIGGLSVVFQSLASFDSPLRQLGYAVLATFSTVLDKMTSPMREAPQMRLLLNVLRAAITVENLRLSSITTSFLGEASLVLVRHDHPLFLELHNYLLSRPALSLTSTPILKRFLVSSRNAWKNEREWALRMVESGLRSPSDLSLLGLRAPGTTKATNSHVLATLISHLSSNLASSFSAISERHRIWSILRKMIINDAPSYKNTLLGPGGIVPFLAIWTSNHALNSDAFAIIPSASIPSPFVYAEVASVLRTISKLPEIQSAVSKSKPLWIQVQPLIGNILQYLQLSYAKLGSLHSNANSTATSSFSSNTTTNDGNTKDKEDENDLADLPVEISTSSLTQNVYWKLLSPCISLIYNFSTNSALPSGAQVSMLNLMQRLFSHLAGPFQPVCPAHLCDDSQEAPKPTSDSMDTDGLTPETEKRNDAPCSCSVEHIAIAKHYSMLAQAIVLDTPDDFTDEHVREWCELAQFALRVTLYLPSTSNNRFLALRTLIGQIIISATTSSRGTLMSFLARAVVDKNASAGRSLIDGLLFAYRQHSTAATTENHYKDHSVVLLLNTFCTLLLAHTKKNDFFGATVHGDWLAFLKSEKLRHLLRIARTLSSNTLHESSLQQVCGDMSSEERDAHKQLSQVFRAFFSSPDLSQPPISLIKSM